MKILWFSHFLWIVFQDPFILYHMGFHQFQCAAFSMYVCAMCDPHLKWHWSLMESLFMKSFLFFASWTLGNCHSLGMPVFLTFPIAVIKHHGQGNSWRSLYWGLTVSEGKYMIIVVRNMAAGRQSFWPVAKVLHLKPPT